MQNQNQNNDVLNMVLNMATFPITMPPAQEKAILEHIRKMKADDISERMKLYDKAEAAKEFTRANPIQETDYSRCPNGCDDYNDRCTYQGG